MIGLKNVSYHVRTAKGPLPVLSDATFVFPREAVALLGPDPVVRRGVIDLVTAAAKPAEGSVRWSGRVSFPIGRHQIFRSHLTGAETTNFFASLYGLDQHRVAAFVRDFTRLNVNFHGRTSDWPMLAGLKFSLILALTVPFDIYVIDSAIYIAGDTDFNERWHRHFAQRIAGKTLVVTSPQAQTLETYCKKAVVAEYGELRLVDDLKRAMLFYPSRQAPTEQPQETADVEQYDDAI